MRKNVYAALQIKRAWKIYPSVLGITALMLCAVLLVGSLALGSFINGADKQKVNIGIVGDISDSYLGVGIYALTNMDSSRFSISFLEMEEKEALAALEARKITGYVKVPPSYISGIINGENVPATFVTYGGPEGFGSVMTAEITGTVSDLVTECQRAMYAMQDLAHDAGETEELWDKVKTINIEYIDFILSRTSIYEVETLGIRDAVSMGGYYICGIIIFFLLLWGISAGRFFTGRNRRADRHFFAHGMGVGRQILSEYFAYCLMTFLTVLLLSLVAGALVARHDFGIPELLGRGFFAPLGFAFAMIPVILMLSAMQFFLYETTENTVSAILLQFLAAIGMGYICGCLYPTTFFPVPLQKIGAALPAGVGFSYLRQSLCGMPRITVWCGVFGYTALFLVAAIAVRKHKMAGDCR
ncbi:MAG: ABC transporter permease [Clostridia bacterium]|nr:ABC transporter permease [Clostridia bacterium]